MATLTQYNAIGRRKTSTARVYLRPGTGKITVNHRDFEDYFPLAWQRKLILEPFSVTETEGRFDVVVNVKGGGLTGQAGAIRMGIARALVAYDESLRPPLRKAGFLTRDPRMVERKKYGQPKARKQYQFSKR